MHEHISYLGLVAVRYNASQGGKYHKNKDWCVEWSQIPDTHSGPEPDEARLQSRYRGWWPAVRVVLEDPEEHVYQDGDTEVFITFLVCLYQAVEEILWAWPIYERNLFSAELAEEAKPAEAEIPTSPGGVWLGSES